MYCPEANLANIACFEFDMVVNASAFAGGPTFEGHLWPLLSSVVEGRDVCTINFGASATARELLESSAAQGHGASSQTPSLSICTILSQFKSVLPLPLSPIRAWADCPGGWFVAL